MRLIDADELKRWVEGHYEHTKYYHPYTKREKYKIPIDEVRDMIDRVPTVDAEPVIRCKECKYVGTDATCFFVCDREGMGLRPYHVYDDDYCPYAERREE